MGRMDGRTVVVTGAARGQGAQEVRRLAEEGAHVIAGDLNDDAGQQLADELTGLPGSVRYRHLDVTSEQSWADLAADLRNAGTPVHGLVNNAGIGVPGRLGALDLETWNRSFDVNVTGAMLGIQALMPLMTEDASIVNIGSVASLIAHHNAAYGAAKWALRGLTKSAAVELAPIRVNIVHPGYIKTPINANADPAFLETHLSLTPLGRGGTVEEMAAVVVFLLSPEASYVTGAEVAVDGGFSGHAGSKPVFDALDAKTGA